MSLFRIVDSTLVAQNIEVNSDVQLVELGRRIKAKDINLVTNYGIGEFIYCKGVVGTVVGSEVLISAEDFSTALAVASDVGMIGVAMSICVADEFGWYQIFGKAVGLVAANFADNATCFLTATAGTIDDAVVTGDQILGMKGASDVGTPETGLALLDLKYPEVTAAVG